MDGEWRTAPRERWRYIGDNTEQLRRIFENCEAPRFDDEIGFHDSKTWDKLSAQQRARSVRAYKLGSYTWGSLESRESDGPLQLDTITPYIVGDNESAVLLSGAYGAQVRAMLGKRKRREAEEILAIDAEADALTRLVKLGGAAYCFTQTWPTPRERDTVQFDYVDEAHRSRVHTAISATLHGDFRTMQYETPPEAYVTPTGERVPFGPAKPEMVIPFYHSSELGILEALLLYQVRRGIKPAVLREQLASELAGQNMSRGYGAMMYGDFGADTMAVRQRAEDLHWRIYEGDGPHAEGLYLNRPYMHMGDDTRITRIVPGDGGVRFTYEDESDHRDNHEFTIPDAHVNRYIALLSSQEFGRTDAGSMRALISTLGMDIREVRRLFQDEFSKSYNSRIDQTPLE